MSGLKATSRLSCGASLTGCSKRIDPIHPLTVVVTGREVLLVTRTTGGIVSNITNIISKDEKIVMRSINIDSHDGLFSGNLVVQLDDKSKLNLLIKKLRTVKGVKQVIRL